MDWNDITLLLLLLCSLIGCMRAWYLEGKIKAYRNMIESERDHLNAEYRKEQE